MSLFGKVEAEIEIKASAYKFYEVNSKRVAKAPKFCPNFIQSVDFFLIDNLCIYSTTWATTQTSYIKSNLRLNNWESILHPYYTFRYKLGMSCN